MATNTTAPPATGGMKHRPRANTLGHIDLSGLSFMGGNANLGRMDSLGLNGNNTNLGALSLNYNYRGMSNAFGNLGTNGLPKLDTSLMNHASVSNSLRTAPPYAFGGFDIDQLFSPGTTINPAQLHFGGSASNVQPNFPTFDPFTVQQTLDAQAQAEDFGWMRTWNMQLGQDHNEQAIDESSPSRMSSGDSPADYNESMNNSTAELNVPNNYSWQQQQRPARHSMSGSIFQMNNTLGSRLPELEPTIEGVASNTVLETSPTDEAWLRQALLHQQQQQALNQGAMQGQHHNLIVPSLSNFNSDSPSMSSSSLTGSARQSSVTSLSTESITDATRHALLLSLAQPSALGLNQRKFSQPSISSNLSPGRNPMQGPNLPSTADIRRYVDAFIHFAHPHLPFLHIPTLSFDYIDQANASRSSPQFGTTKASLRGGVGCLILGMAAIGALYEYDHPASRDLFDAAKKMLSLYLEERRRADMSAAANGSGSPGSGSRTPLWLVQAMLLSVIYGHQCGDKTAADIASNHCAALVSLARAADLTQPVAGVSPENTEYVAEQVNAADVAMRESSIEPADSISRHHSAELDLQTQWLAWKITEERKRTLFAIFIISSLLTTAYNHTPTIMNSELMLELPCDEELWSAESAQEWHNRGGQTAARQHSITFAAALSTLLTANQRQGSHYASSAYNNSNPLGALQAGDAFADNDLRPSTFGCLVLINALHNYIWETRSRHHGRQWTPQETESMFSHIEPALNAWQAAWKANNRHKLERPNPFGAGPLSADSIPLLDLAFVRLFVNLGQSKEALWRRDFDAMADELARGSEIVQHADAGLRLGDDREGSFSTPSSNGSANEPRASQAPANQQSSTKRERHLRKAAFYAADSLTIACSYGLTYADLAAHELPVQSAMCFFDCSQVLAEWACTVQERVGKYLGVLGRDAIDYSQVPAIIVLETEDVELLRKMERICESLEAKRFQQENLLALDLQNINAAAVGSIPSLQSHLDLSDCGYGSKILRITALMLEKAVVWPGESTCFL